MVLKRLKEYIDYKGLTISFFEKSIGMSNASFGKSLKNGGSIGSDKLENILFAYPDINTEWLLTGIGEMLKSDNGEVGVSLKEHEELKENLKLYSDSFWEEKKKVKEKEYIIEELLNILKENNIPVKITEIEKRANRSYGESQQETARNVG